MYDYAARVRKAAFNGFVVGVVVGALVMSFVASLLLVTP